MPPEPAGATLAASPAGLRALPLRLHPGDDLRAAIAAAMHDHPASFVLQGIGSLSVARLRFAGRPQPDELVGDLEILTLAGSVCADGPHLHMAIADAQGRVMGGHVAPGCIVRTTAELLLAVLPDHAFARTQDATTGYPELAITRR